MREVMHEFELSRSQAQWALVELKRDGKIEHNGLRASELRWGPIGILAHQSTLNVERKAKAAARKRERNRMHQQKRVRAKQGIRVYTGPLTNIQRLVQRVPVSVWDYARPFCGPGEA